MFQTEKRSEVVEVDPADPTMETARRIQFDGVCTGMVACQLVLEGDALAEYLALKDDPQAQNKMVMDGLTASAKDAIRRDLDAE